MIKTYEKESITGTSAKIAVLNGVTFGRRMFFEYDTPNGHEIVEWDIVPTERFADDIDLVAELNVCLREYIANQYNDEYVEIGLYDWGLLESADESDEGPFKIIVSIDYYGPRTELDYLRAEETNKIIEFKTYEDADNKISALVNGTGQAYLAYNQVSPPHYIIVKSQQ